MKASSFFSAAPLSISCSARRREQNPAILPTPSFYQALEKEGMSYICEVKKASPSKGLIAPDFPYVEIAKEYEAAGASAILSCNFF